ncbi:hypothetical protein [Rothia halotolerans]|uniref:hypothetical protein n=1 Tax=Rothia halotolerans TaxID=405770 RepID=UPI00101D1705|nr:hypothetical protein [Rothia halotolerans]
MTASRWEKERSAHLLSRSEAGTPKRRRAELLARRARRLSRGGMGTAESSFSEDVTQQWWREWVQAGDRDGEKASRFLLVMAAFGLLWLVLGPALVIAFALYGLLWIFAPRIGRLWAWPWLAAAAAVLAVGAYALSHSAAEPVTVSAGFVPEFDWSAFLFMAIWGQLVAGLVLTSYYIVRSGWAAVPQGAVPKPVKNKDGSYRKVAEKEKVRLDPYAGAPVAAVDSTEPQEKKVSLAAESEPQDEEPEDQVDEEEPLFSDEDEEWDFDEVEKNDEGHEEGEKS